jgi:hypothetical protein
MTSRRSRLRAVPGILFALLLAGCVAIPTGGNVNTVTIDTDVDDVAQISLPEGPEPGQDMAQILQGFLRAGRGPQDDYRVAKEFLAPGTEWAGTDQVLISSSSISPVEVDGDTLAVTLTVAAEVDATGRYISGASQQTLTYDFTEVDGEMRISGAAPGTVLSPNGFAVVFEEYPLYFFDPSFSYLVPDLRWFPEDRGPARRIVTELLAGPAPWLGSGVLISAFPAASTGVATFDAPDVTVDLSADVRAESGRTQRRMLEQLYASLRALPNVSEQTIQVTAEGLALDPAADTVALESRYVVSDAIGGYEGVFGTLTADGVVSLTAIGDRADALNPRAAALSRDRESLAVLGDGGVSLLRATGDPVLIDDRARLIAPTLDPYGFVWTVPANDPRGLRATDADGVSHTVSLGAGGRVKAIELSRDGARLLVALETSDGPRLFVAGVLRDADLAPVALGAPYELRAPEPIADIAWVDGMRIAVLADGDAGTTVQVLPLGGPLESLGPVDGKSIVGGNLTSGIRVLSPEGTVMRPGVGNWVNTNLVASFLGTQQ